MPQPPTLPGHEGQLDEVEERGQVAEPGERAHRAGQVGAEQVVRGVGDQVVVLLGEHPLLLVVLVAGFFRPPRGPARSRACSRGPRTWRPGPCCERGRTESVGLELEVEVLPGLRAARRVAHGFVRRQAGALGRPEAGVEPHRHPVGLLQVDGGQDPVDPGLVVGLGFWALRTRRPGCASARCAKRALLGGVMSAQGFSAIYVTPTVSLAKATAAMASSP